jgi:hypothetical protein
MGDDSCSHLQEAIMTRLEGGSPKTLFEWLSGLGFPDSSLTVLIGLFVALTLGPYFGGSKVSLLGSGEVSVPTFSAGVFWILVFLAPFMWAFVFFRIIGGYWKYSVVRLIAALCVSILLVGVQKLNPAVALSAVSAGFTKTFELDFKEFQHSWIASHDSDGKYCHFRTPRLDLGPEVRPGCAMRIDAIQIIAPGYAFAPNRSGFDLEAYVSTSDLLPETEECVPAVSFEQVRVEPNDPEVTADAVVETRKEKTLENGQTNYTAVFDFANNAAQAEPGLQLLKNSSRKDIHVSSNLPALQISGYTLWGDPSTFQLNSLEIKVTGRLECGFWF